MKGNGLPRQSKPDGPRLQAVEDSDWTLDIPEDQKQLVMAERELSVDAYKRLGTLLQYCLPREDKPLPPGEREQYHITDDSCRVWIDNPRKQRLNAVMPLQFGVIEARFFGPNQDLNACFFQACVKLGVSTRYSFGRASKEYATSVLFKLRDDEAGRLDEDYSGFKPQAFTLEGERRGVMINYAPAKKSSGQPIAAIAPGSLMWHADSVSYDLIKWRGEGGQAAGARHSTGASMVDFFTIVRAAAFASILNIVKTSVWQSKPARWAFAECLARIVLAGQAINANVVFSKSARAIIADPGQAELLIALIAEAKSLPETKEECRDKFRLAQSRLKADPNTHTVSGWSSIRQWFGAEAHDALRGVLTVGADSSLLETFAERYLFIENDKYIDRLAHKDGRPEYTFSKDKLCETHAADQILTKKKPVKAFPIFAESKMRQLVTGMELHPDSEAGAVLRVTRQGVLIPNDDYAPEHSRLIFNQWAGLYIKPAKAISDELRAECERRLDQMLIWVARTPERIAWIKAHMGWTLKNPGQKQQVALVCTGGQGTGKTFLCKDFAHAVFDQYANVASVRALDEQFYIPAYVGKLWVNHDEVVSKSENIQIIKELIRSTRVSGQFKGQDVRTHTVYARLAFTSNETNPGLSRGELDRGLFQVTSISPATMNKLPGEFEQWTGKNLKPFYAEYDAFLKRDDVRQAYVRLLMDCAPATIAEVEDITHSATHDSDVAAEQLTPAQQVAREIIEEGTIWGGWDIAMPFNKGHLQGAVKRVAKNMGIPGFMPADAVLSLFFDAGILQRPENGAPYMFRYKIGGLIRLFGDFLHVPLNCHWPIDPATDDMPNDYRAYEDKIPWKGRGK